MSNPSPSAQQEKGHSLGTTSSQGRRIHSVPPLILHSQSQKLEKARNNQHLPSAVPQVQHQVSQESHVGMLHINCKRQQEFSDCTTQPGQSLGSQKSWKSA